MSLSISCEQENVSPIVPIVCEQENVNEFITIYNADIPANNKCYGSDSTVIGHIYGKLLKITPDSFKIKKAREIAKGRYDFVKEFAERYVGEVEGKL